MGPMVMASKQTEQHMDTMALRKFMHDLSNALNAAKINTYLLRRVHGEVVDKDTLDGLDTALHDAERLVGEFQKRVHAEETPPGK